MNMRNRVGLLKRLTAIMILGLMILPVLSSAVPLQNDKLVHNQVDEVLWWENTNMDENNDYIHDAIWIAAENNGYEYLDENNMISVIVDFDHTPTIEDELMLEENVLFEVQFRYWLINSIAGKVNINLIPTIIELPGVVFVELDGRLEIQMNDVNEVHDVTQVWEETGYTGAGSVVAIIDTGIDSDHVGLDDIDDSNYTNDTKVIAFYDAVNYPELTNGTEIKAYDDQGHGTHCAGITAGTGAPDFQYKGVAPKAQLVGVKVLDSGGSGSFATVMAGMEWTVEKRHVFNIRAASMSLGGPGAIEWTSSEEESVNRMGNEMMREGVALFIAAGNSAFSAQIGTPGSAEDVITVGALDKNTAIAVYSSQGPTEEGRVKPNIAFVGSSVMAPDFNTGDGYTSKSGTSMATPGAAGLAALMYQANPDLSPFDIRNIMQETATYRRCDYMFANEPCVEDNIPKNRQNNVYGHGHVNSVPSVMEAANKVYELSLTLNITLASDYDMDNRVFLNQDEVVQFNVEGGATRVQWRTWDMRDNWMDLAGFDADDTTFTVTHSLLVDRLQYLPNNTVEGDQVLLVRAITNEKSSTNLAVDIHIIGDEKISSEDSSSSNNAILIGILSVLVLILFAGLTIATMKLKETGFWEDEEYEDFSSFDNLVKHKEEALDNPDESSD
ncbi:MAG: S8 family serine peptidase [Euryarchaeota archaeon]|nr:S8 family serine peptidase [Euryarchaeota archaeon]MBT4156665.1 S8 family serine peptidase [Euryarchaeota archaeon]MBT4180624.1 S8 family serine peptidase [Euryarchaeota archaeon]MBT4475685.1 S8 family serine peptidase [Euryarchaeota archaeon]MBT4794104.1 S8 family serine peptidase [Euryarchaeota archaeon]